MAGVTQPDYSYEHMFASTQPRPSLSAELIAKVRPVALATTKTLPLGSPWSEIVPSGALRRGTTTVVDAAPGHGGLSLALGLVGAASAKGHWVGVVGVDDPGVVAMKDLGVDLRRVLFVPRPRGAWAESTADLLDGVDLVIVRPPSVPAHGAARKLADRVRERGAVMIALGESRARWPLPADLSLKVTQANWHASSRLNSREVTVVVSGRGLAHHGGEHVVTLPPLTRRGDR